MTVLVSFRHIKYKINERDHSPPHVHCEAFGAEVRINLLTLQEMDESTEFGPSTLRKIKAFVKENREWFLEEWEKRHGKKN